MVELGAELSLITVDSLGTNDHSVHRQMIGFSKNSNFAEGIFVSKDAFILLTET